MTNTQNPALALLEQLVDDGAVSALRDTGPNARGIADVIVSMATQARLNGELFQVIPANTVRHRRDPFYSGDIRTPLIVMRSNACGCKTLQQAESSSEAEYFARFQPGGNLHAHTLTIQTNGEFAQLGLIRLEGNPIGYNRPVLVTTYTQSKVGQGTSFPLAGVDLSKFVDNMVRGDDQSGLVRHQTSRTGLDPLPSDLVMLPCLARYIKLRATAAPCTTPGHNG